jgi:hypothetical protein
VIIDALRWPKADVVVVLAEGTAEVVARHGMRLVADVPLDVAAQVLWSHMASSLHQGQQRDGNGGPAGGPSEYGNRVVVDGNGGQDQSNGNWIILGVMSSSIQHRWIKIK